MEETPQVVEYNQADAISLEALLVSRAHLYLLFNRLFGGNTTEELINCLVGQTTRDAIEEYAQDNAELKTFLGLLDSFAAQDRAAFTDAARDEYTRQFIGPGATPAPITESPYITGDLATMQENTVVVRQIYHAQGLRAKREERVPDDHIALECAFMAHMAKRSLDLFRAGDFDEVSKCLQEQAAFIQNHLANWLPSYAEQVRTKSVSTVLFPQLVEALSVFVSVDETFALEAAYWAGAVQVPEEGTPALPEDVAQSFALADAACKQLEDIQLVGLDDNELIVLENKV